jgi:glycosyltransferase involved in cell wall biosynthesis
MRAPRHNRRVKVRFIDSEHSLAGKRGDAIVCVPVYGAHELFVKCLATVMEHTPPDVPILICDDASPDERTHGFVVTLDGDKASERELFYIRRDRNVGFPANVNGAFAAAAPADVVILNSDCEVAEGWIDGLRAAAYSDSRVATATSLTNHGSIVSVPGPQPGPLPAEWRLDDAAAAVRAGSLRIRPWLPTAIGHCVYIRRSALELVGDFDLAFTPGYGEEVDFSQRCLQAGLSHVLADDVLVLHHGAGSFSRNGQPDPAKEQHERLLATRYPYYHQTVRALERDRTGPLARALGAARRSLQGVSVLIDARTLTGPMTGTQVQVLEVLKALAATDQMRLTALVPDGLSDYGARALRALPGVEQRNMSDYDAGRLERFDIVHRPFQVHHEADVKLLVGLGDRLVITHQDLIGYHNPAYYRDYEEWREYRRFTRLALAIADHVVFVSSHARDEALAEDLVDEHRTSVVHNGVDHRLVDVDEPPRPPRGAERLPPSADAILCLGTDFNHKNRLFALRLVEELRRRHGWDGYLLFAGPHVDRGSSTDKEAELIRGSEQLSGRVLDFKAVSESEKRWLLDRARLMLYPTVHEGFGLVPFEAAEQGLPCLWAHGTSLSEILPESEAGIIPWNLEQSAEQALALLREDGARERNLSAIRTATAGLTWAAAASKLVEIYRAVCAAPPSDGSVLERRDARVSGGLSEDAMRLVGPGGAIPEELERPLLALATHRQFSAPIFGAVKFGYQVSYRIRRRRPTTRRRQR